MIDIKEMFLEGIVGTVEYNKDEDSYQLNIGNMDVGLYPIWEKFEGKRIRIKVELMNK